MSTASPQGGAAASRLPLFYRDPQPLSSSAHADWRIGPGDASFAKDAAFVPVVVAEFAAAGHSYPLVFAAPDAAPIALLGLERANLFVDQGRWAEEHYVPAYVRRYPFGFMTTAQPDNFALAIDAASERVLRGGDTGEPLFKDGAPTDATRQALKFCESFQAEAAATRAFSDALIAHKLLIDRRADATLPDGRKLGLDGFQVVDAEKFGKLEDAVVLEWHRKGWLALVHFHLASLDRFSLLLARQGKRGAKAA